MHGRFMRAAATAAMAGALATSPWTAPGALAATRGVVAVPCSASGLTSAFSSAASGGTLALAPWCHYDLSAPLPAITGKLTILGDGATIARSAGVPGFAILTVGGPPGYLHHTVRIANLNVSNGSPGIYLDSGTLFVTGGTFSGNTTAISSDFFTALTVSGATFTGNTGKWGGAILGSDTVKLGHDVFTGNSAQRGGAVYVQNGRQTVSDCRFAGNSATHAGGGLYDDGHVTMTGTAFTGNQAPAGGAISVFDPTYASLAVTGSAFTANRAQTGGAIYNYDGLTVTGSTFTANHATQGGAIDQDWYAALTGDSFTRNSASARGGAMFGGYNTVVSGSTFTRNTAGTDGGAIDNGLGSLNFAGTLTLTGGSITANSAGTDGGGIFNDDAARATAAVSSTILASNQPDNCAPSGAVSGCTVAGGRVPGGRRATASRSVPAHHGGHIAGLLLRELTGG
jgi:predicted outer membrane repeat protein